MGRLPTFDCDQAASLLGKGMPVVDVASTLHVRPHAIYHFARRRGIQLPVRDGPSPAKRAGDLKRRKYPDIQVGDTFGDQTALESTVGMKRVRDMRIKVRCGCGNVHSVSPHALWRSKTKSCFECSVRRIGAMGRGRPTPLGTEIGNYVVVDYGFTPKTGNGSTVKRHRFVLRDNRCGHLHEVFLSHPNLPKQVQSGRKTYCYCPVRYVNHGYVWWEWRRGGRKVKIAEHRIVMESVLGRELHDYETVHHINGDRLDNRPENLQLRTGNHGNGIVMVCKDCGSQNVEPAPIAEVA